MNRTILTCLFLLLAIFMHAQDKPLKTADEARQLSQRAMKLFNEKKIGAAFDELHSHWPLPEEEFSDLREKTMKYFTMLESRFGIMEGGFQKIREETIKDFALRETYVIRYKYSAIRFIFFYYKNEEGWVINGFKWDDQLSEEFR